MDIVFHLSAGLFIVLLAYAVYKKKWTELGSGVGIFAAVIVFYIGNRISVNIGEALDRKYDGDFPPYVSIGVILMFFAPLPLAILVYTLVKWFAKFIGPKSDFKGKADTSKM